MDNIELEDLVYTYPSNHDPNFQAEIAAKEEFREIAGRTSEPVPKRGQLFRHQKVLKRLMLQYDEQLLIHSVGTGKTCSVVSVAEHYKAIAGALEELRQISTEVPDVPFKRAIILVKGDNLVDEFKFQIVCKCTNGDYITDQILNSKTETQRKQNVSRSVGKYYTITTYGTFAKTVFALTDEQLINEFSHCIFVVDEVHNIKDEKGGGILRTDPKTGNTYYVKIEKGEDKIITDKLNYDQLFRVFHTVKPRKVMLSSATPMINDAAELGPRLNLILPLDRQIPDNINWKTVNLETLEPYFRGLISYVRALDTGAIPIYQGKILTAEYNLNEEEPDNPVKVKSQMVVYGTEMKEKQLKVYQQSVEDPKSLRPESDKPEAFDDLKRQAANFIFPDNSTASVGYRKYVKEEKNVFTPTPEFAAWLQDFNYLQQLSCKFAEIIRLCKNNPGNCWCYSHYIRGSGAVVLGMAFEAQGFERFNETNSVFGEVSGSSLPALCGNKSLDEKRDRVIRIPKKLRYALLTSETTNPEAFALLEAFNSYENRHGEYIKAVIGSPVTRDGLNFANVLQIHLVGPEWNESGIYQAESRAIRSTSHVDLIEEERERLRQAGLNPDDAKIEIKVYRHAALDEMQTSIDIQMYEISEIKDRQIKRIIRMMKQCASDCLINYTRNVRPTDIDYSASCDYDICAYKCINQMPNYIDTTSYDVLYSEDIIAAAKNEIIDIFRLIFQISYLNLYEELKDISGIKRKFVDIAVNELIENKTPIYNRFGYLSYLREDRGTLFLKNDFPLGLLEGVGASSLSEYSSNLLGVNFTSLIEYNGSLQRGQGNILDIFKGLDRDKTIEKIESLTLENQILLVETTIIEYYIKKNRSDILAWILDKFRNHIFIVYEPKKAIEIVAKAISERGKGRGRKPKEGSKFKLTEARRKEVEEALKISSGKNEIIYFHNLSNLSQALTSYNIAAKSIKAEGKIRLLKPNENVGWREANEAEEIVYNLIIGEKMRESQTEYDIYGTILEDGNFRIVDKTTEDVSLAGRDRRKVNRGRKCHDGWKKPELIALMWKLNYNPFNIEIKLNRPQLIEYVVGQKLADRSEAEEFSNEQLRFYYSWASSSANIHKMCDLLQKYFQDTNRLVIS